MKQTSYTHWVMSPWPFKFNYPQTLATKTISQLFLICKTGNQFHVSCILLYESLHACKLIILFSSYSSCFLCKSCQRWRIWSITSLWGVACSWWTVALPIFGKRGVSIWIRVWIYPWRCLRDVWIGCPSSNWQFTKGGTLQGKSNLLVILWKRNTIYENFIKYAFLYKVVVVVML